MAVLVTVTIRETLLVASAAVTVMVLTPIASGMPEIDQVVPLIDDPSDAAVLVTQVTAGAPLPPVTVPEREIVAEVVVAGNALIVRTSGLGIVAVLVTVTTRETLPVASAAVTVMVFTPIASGMLKMDQIVPLMEDPSDAPVLVIQVTDGVPLPPVTVPESEIVAEVVVAGGTLTVNARGPARVRVTLTTRETLPVASVAVTVMVLTPIANGTLKMDQFVPLIVDPSDAPVLVIQVTDGVPPPPVTVPESEIVAEVVVAGGALMVNARGPGCVSTAA